MDINQLISERKRLENKISLCFALRESYTSSDRSNLIIAYYDLIVEHHSAIYLLIENSLYGSAFALVRIYFELVYKIHWVAFVAGDNIIQKIIADNFNFPKMKDIVTAIDQALDTDKFWTTIHSKSWKAMNDYTHTGVRQVARRFSSGSISSNYSQDEIIEVLNSSNIIYLMVTIMVFKYLKWDEEALFVEELWKKYLDSNSCVQGES